MSLNEAAMVIMVAIDACEQYRYDDAKEILSRLPKVVVRTKNAGVHYGRLAFIANAQHGCYRVVMEDCRRIWSWDGANTLNEVALHGPARGKISEPTVNIIPQVIEVLPCTEESESKLRSIGW